MSATWTPGPWSVAEGDGQYLWEVRAPDQTAKARRTVARPCGPDRLANARLIAAAPDLAETLEKLLADYVAQMAGLATLGAEVDVVIAARAALSKARGETA